MDKTYLLTKKKIINSKGLITLQKKKKKNLKDSYGSRGSKVELRVMLQKKGSAKNK